MRVTITEPAGSDLDDIYARILEDAPAAAVRLLEELTAAARSLDQFPHRGRPGRRAGTRELVVRRHIIVYRVRSDQVDVLRFHHHAQLR